MAACSAIVSQSLRIQLFHIFHDRIQVSRAFPRCMCTDEHR